eukprot:CAMPEP_0183787682 /NCGR_PEP_ID=MMETSP0739-20130205/67669_1 /TAXON_ID=385413 /ORGANISM="Thalassiosira miniscula, Strain CCMP1093" /LENGTH=287 /DNA_ID=CAMNT_0026031773 /DNA_START=181 /DNA_END=1041 /DNA_ORIENTATION=+
MMKPLRRKEPEHEKDTTNGIKPLTASPPTQSSAEVRLVSNVAGVDQHSSFVFVRVNPITKKARYRNKQLSTKVKVVNDEVGNDQHPANNFRRGYSIKIDETKQSQDKVTAAQEIISKKASFEKPHQSGADSAKENLAHVAMNKDQGMGMEQEDFVKNITGPNEALTTSYPQLSTEVKVLSNAVKRPTKVAVCAIQQAGTLSQCSITSFKSLAQLHPQIYLNKLRRELAMANQDKYEEYHSLFAAEFRKRLEQVKKQMVLHIPKTGGTTLCQLAKSHGVSTTKTDNCW